LNHRTYRRNKQDTDVIQTLASLQPIGESGLGKTTFINTLFTTTIKAPKTYKRRFNNSTTEKTVEIEIIRAGMLLPYTSHLDDFFFTLLADFVTRWNTASNGAKKAKKREG
jgi:hypothetical protein